MASAVSSNRRRCLASFNYAASGWLAIPLVVAVAACTYEAPNSADRAKPTYQADLTECQAFGDKEGHRLVLAYGGLFLTYPFSLPIEEWRQTRICMIVKGYAANG